MVERSSTEKIRIFRRLFTGLDHVYGTYDTSTGKVRQVKEPVTDRVIRAHLTGKQSYGVYLLTGNTTRALAVDFDADELALPVAFQAGARRYGMSAYIERSKAKGYHVWIFFEKPVLASKARLVAQKILTDIDKANIEIFPKQDALNSNVSYGNFINAPLFGSLVHKGRTVFVDPAEQTKPCPDQWELLERIQRVEEVRLNAIINSCGLNTQNHDTRKPPAMNHIGSERENTSFGLTPCIRKMLAYGVESYQRVSCYRLGIQLKRIGIPYDLAVITLKAWAFKNHPADGKRTITEAEVESQTKIAFDNPYTNVGCEEPAVAAHCDKGCPLYSTNRRQATERAIQSPNENTGIMI